MLVVVSQTGSPADFRRGAGGISNSNVVMFAGLRSVVDRSQGAGKEGNSARGLGSIQLVNACSAKIEARARAHPASMVA